MLGDFPSGHRINPQLFLEGPWQNLPAMHTTYGVPQNIQKTLECAKNVRDGHLQTVGYATQVLKSDICTASAQFKVGVIGLGIPRPYQRPQGVGS